MAELLHVKLVMSFVIPLIGRGGEGLGGEPIGEFQALCLVGNIVTLLLTLIKTRTTGFLSSCLFQLHRLHMFSGLSWLPSSLQFLKPEVSPYCSEY